MLSFIKIKEKIVYKKRVYLEYIRLFLLKKRIITAYKHNADPELKSIVKFLKQNPINVFPYSFVKKYNPESINVQFDSTLNLPFIDYFGKKLFLQRTMNKARLKKYVNSLFIEQDSASPHRYLNENFNVNPGDVVFDVGTAEGNFSLGVVDVAQKIYLFEPGADWLEPLQATFNPWKEKVFIISKFVSDNVNENTVTIDSITEDKIDFLKVDVEGFETKILDGATKLLNEKKIKKTAICTYHQQQDEKIINTILTNKGFTVNSTNGYMLFYYDKNIAYPYFRKGLLRAIL